jgi:serine/threonine protein kinase
MKTFHHLTLNEDKENEIKRVKREIAIIKQLNNSPNILKFVEAFEHEKDFHLITEYCLVTYLIDT